MAVIIGDSVFLHIPKTGGSWLRVILKKYGGQLYYPPREAGGFERILCDGKELHHLAVWPSTMRPERIIAVVRAPVSWYRSFWLYRTTSAKWQWSEQREFDARVGSNDFTEFIRNVAREFPGGFLSRLYNAYLDKCTEAWTVSTLTAETAWYLGVREQDLLPPANCQKQDFQMSLQDSLYIDSYEREAACIVTSAR